MGIEGDAMNVTVRRTGRDGGVQSCEKSNHVRLDIDFFTFQLTQQLAGDWHDGCSSL